jgi:hypothetical protein
MVVVASDEVPVVKRLPTVIPPVEDALVRYVCPETVRFVVEAFVTVSDVNVGVLDTAIVEVEVNTMLDPAMR